MIAPDLTGFGFSERPEQVQYGLRIWVDQIIGLLNNLEQAHLIGNSFGGAIALRWQPKAPTG